MKKNLLKAIALLFALALPTQNAFSAESGWTSQFTPVNDAAELGKLCTATTADGSVYASSTYNQAFSFAGSEVADPEGLTSAFIAKYDANGKEVWGITMFGNATISALDADADGTLYVAGQFMDVVEYTGTNGVKGEISSPSSISAFIAKVSKDGKFEAVKTFTSETDEAIASAVGDPWGDGFESPLYSAWDPIYVAPNNIQIDGDKVYVSAKYTGDVKELGWEGSYVDVFGMMYSDNYSYGVLSLNKSDLSNAKSIATVQNTELVSYDQFYPEALNFVAENGTVYVGFFGFGNLTLNTGTATNFNFANDYEGGLEHAFVLAAINNGEATTKVFNAEKHDKSAKPYNVFMDASGDELIISGTYYGQNPFDNTLSTGELANDIFVASVAKANGAANWTYVSGIESKAICAATFASQALLSTTAGSIAIDLSTKAASTSEEIFAGIATYGTTSFAQIYNEGASVVVASGIAQSEPETDSSYNWYNEFSPVNDAAELGNVRTATAADGSVYVSSTYNQAFNFATSSIADPEGLTSAFIAKYEVNGQEAWGITMFGNATISALDADADGTLYVAGQFMDVVEYTGTNGVKGEISSPSSISAFIAKVSKDGKFEAVKTFTSETDEAIASAVGDPWGDGFESPLYSAWDPIYVAPNNIQIDGDKVYVSAKYTGDVKELGWEGSYVDVFGMMYSDNYSYGVLSLNKSDLSNAKSIATVQNTELVSYDQFYPEALNFVAENGTVYVGFFGFGNLTLNTGTATNFNFANDYEGGLEHAFVLAAINNGEATTKVFNAEKHDKSAKPYNVFMDASGDELIISGTYYGQNPFDNTLSTGELANDIFVASVAKADGAANWTYVSGIESKATCMGVNNTEALVSSTAGTVSIDLGTNEKSLFEEIYSDMDFYGELSKSKVQASDTRVGVCGWSDSTVAIEDVVIFNPKNNGVIYNLAGQIVDENYKGIIIKNGKKYLNK